MDTEDPSVIAASERLLEAAASGVPCAPVRDLIGASDIEAAYAVQARGTAARLAAGATVVGRKIGLTSKAVQKQIGVDQPDLGYLFDDMAYGELELVPMARLLQPKAEAEVAFVLKEDLVEGDFDDAQIRRAVDYITAAIEIVDSRVANWDIKIWDTIADNASSGLFVLGAVPRKLDGLDLRTCGMVMEIKGEPVSVGAGIACLGSPITASLWLARVMAKVGRPLLEGDVILSGALGPMTGVSRGDVVEARINGIGTVRAAFAAESS